MNFSVAYLIRHLSRMKHVWRAATIVGLAVAAAYLLFAHLAYPSVLQFNTIVALDTKAGRTGLYPNGVTFAPTDIRSPAVLESVYQSLGLSQYGLSRSEFDAAVAVTPYSAVREQIDLSFASRMAAPKLSLDERSKLEDQYQDAIKTVDSGSAKLTLTLRGNLNLPENVALAILDALPRNWSRIFVDEFGIANAASTIQSATLVDTTQLATMDPILSYRYLSDAYTELSARIGSLRALPGISSKPTGASGLGINDIEREATTLGRIWMDQNLKPIAYAGVTATPQETLGRLRAERADETEARQSAERKIKLLDEVIEQATFNSPPSQPSFAAQSQPQIAATPTLSDNAISQLIELALQGADRPFLHDLLREKQQAGDALSDIERSISELDRLISAVIAQKEAPNTPSPQSMSDKTSAAVAAQMNGLWAQMNELALSVSSSRLNAEKSIYQMIPYRDARVLSGGLYSFTPWAFACLIALLCTLAVLTFGLVRSFLHEMIAIDPAARKNE